MRRFTAAMLLWMLTIPALGSARAAGKHAMLKGYVIDSACTFVQDLKKPISSHCAVACAKAGSPLVILADDGSIYWPISAQVPAPGQNQRLLPFAGERVTVAGTVYQKGGSKAIVISKIAKAGNR